MSTHMIDSQILKDLYGNSKIRKIFSDENMLKKWIDTEVALAQAEAELGVIPLEAYEEIKKKGKTELFDMGQIRKGIDQTAHPLITFIRIFEENCVDGLGEYVHYGATTQDISDTGLVLQMKEGYDYIKKQLNEFVTVLAKQTLNYRDTPMSGRTHGQHALPITLGFKLATWLSELDRHKNRLEDLYHRVFVGQFGGAVGTLASLGEHGFKVQNRMMEILGLNVPDITWHTARDNFAELASVYAMIAGTIGKIANEITNLQRTEIAEIEEGFVAGKVGSSTMPHKRNPMICEYLMGLSRLIRNQMASVYDSLVQDHERDMGLWLVEWEIYPEISIYLSRMIEQITTIIENMIVNKENMRRNLDITGGLILSEKMMFTLSSYVGKQTAHEIMYETCMAAYENNVPVAEELVKNEIVKKYISEEKIKETLNPEKYMGLSVEFVDKVLSTVNNSATEAR